MNDRWEIVVAQYRRAGNFPRVKKTLDLEVKNQLHIFGASCNKELSIPPGNQLTNWAFQKRHEV
jgi:hypothetical protein